MRGKYNHIHNMCTYIYRVCVCVCVCVLNVYAKIDSISPLVTCLM